MTRTSLLSLVSLAILMMAGPLDKVSGADREASSAGRTADTTASKLYRGLAGYLEGMHGEPKAPQKPGAGKAKSHNQNRDGAAIKTVDSEPGRILKHERELARLRVQRHEWDLAVSALERALEAAKKASAAKEADEIREMLQEARLKVSSISQQAPAVGGEITNTIGMRLVLLPAGRFLMGSSGPQRRRVQNDWNISNDMIDPEGPAHAVRITYPFAMGKYEVTAGQFKRFVE